MQIERYTFEHRNDFKAIMKCEHCGHEQPLNNGYNDHYFHNHVIPAIACQSCGKDGKSAAA